jgi:hypothetical protein
MATDLGALNIESMKKTKTPPPQYTCPVTGLTVPLAMFTDYTYAPYNPGVYAVTKIKNQCTYLVDLLEYGGAGSCTCDDFLYRGDPENRHGTNPHRACKHNRTVRILVARGTLPPPPVEELIVSVAKDPDHPF